MNKNNTLNNYLFETFNYFVYKKIKNKNHMRT